jgi:hypothetical protein
MNLFKNILKHKKELEQAKDLWLNYAKHYIRYYIHYIDPLTKKKKIYKFCFIITREMQRDKKELYSRLAIEEGQGMLRSTGYWKGQTNKGTFITDPIHVEFEEISKKEYDEAK